LLCHLKFYEADQDFERFGKTLIANFKDTATLWEFLRASLRQCHIHKLSKVGKDKAAWAKADEYLTNLMDSDTVLTLENTDEAIKRVQNYMQRQDNDGEKHVAFSSASDESNDDEEMKALRAELKEKDQRASVGTRGQVRQILKRAKGRQQQAPEGGEEE
jgi:predicted Zn-dependent protease